MSLSHGDIAMDTQFVRRLDDAGFIDSLYDAAPAETSKTAR